MAWRVSRKAARGQVLDEADPVFNKESNRIRARVEHPFEGQAPVGVPPDPVSRVSPERGPGLYALRAGPFLPGSQGASPPVGSVYGIRGFSQYAQACQVPGIGLWAGHSSSKRSKSASCDPKKWAHSTPIQK